MMLFSSSNSYLCKIGTIFQSLLLLALRLIWGYGFFKTGLGKLQNPETTSQFFANLHILFPTVMAYVVGVIEFGGGLLLILGLFTRLAAIPLICVMIGAYVTAHSSALVTVFTNPETFFSQSPFMFLFTAVFLFAFGPGLFSLDALFCQIYCKKVFKCKDDDQKSA